MLKISHMLRGDRVHLSAAILVGTALLTGCATPVRSQPSVQPEWLDCPRVATFSDLESLSSALPAVHEKNGGRDLLIYQLSVYGCPCSDAARLGTRGEDSRVAGAGESSRLGSAGEDSRVGGAGEDARLGSAGENARLGSAGEDARLGSAGEDARLGSAGENARLGSTGEGARVGGTGEDARLGAAGENARLGGKGETIRCAKINAALGYIVKAERSITVHIYDGFSLYKLTGRNLEPVDSLIAGR